MPASPHISTIYPSRVLETVKLAYRAPRVDIAAEVVAPAGDLVDPARIRREEVDQDVNNVNN